MEPETTTVTPKKLKAHAYPTKQEARFLALITHYQAENGEGAIPPHKWLAKQLKVGVDRVSQLFSRTEAKGILLRQVRVLLKIEEAA